MRVCGTTTCSSAGTYAVFLVRPTHSHTGRLTADGVTTLAVVPALANDQKLRTPATGVNLSGEIEDYRRSGCPAYYDGTVDQCRRRRPGPAPSWTTMPPTLAFADGGFTLPPARRAPTVLSETSIPKAAG